MTLVALAGGLAALLFLGLAVFQAALATGAPLGRYAWGGSHEHVLPPRLQLGSALAVPLLLGMALIVSIRAGLIYPDLSAQMTWPTWTVFLFMTMNTFANLRSGSRDERRVMGPLALLLAVLVAYVAISLG